MFHVLMDTCVWLDLAKEKHRAQNYREAFPGERDEKGGRWIYPNQRG
jgi:hypothetical protein